MVWIRTISGLLAAVMAVMAQGPPTMFPPVRGTREMVGAANNFEVEAGFRMLTMGGNAVDAGVAAVLAAAVTEQARFGIGGEMPLLVKMAGKPVVAISGVGTAPKAATVAYYENRSAATTARDQGGTRVGNRSRAADHEGGVGLPGLQTL